MNYHATTAIWKVSGGQKKAAKSVFSIVEMHTLNYHTF